MNCSSAQRLLSAERDDALAPEQRAAFEAHVANCPECRRARTAVASAVEAWRASQSSVQIPNTERAWQDIRREIRHAGAPTVGRRVAPFARWGGALGAAAALALAWLTWAPSFEPRESVSDVARTDAVGVEFIEVPAEAASVVYVDDESGWLVVWADSPQLAAHSPR